MTATCAELSYRLTLNARTAADLMSRQVVSIAEDAPIGEAIATLVDRGFGGAPVVNAAGRAVGVISLSDIVVHDRNRGGYELPITVVNEDPTLARDVMTPAVCAVRPDTPAPLAIHVALRAILVEQRLAACNVSLQLQGVPIGFDYLGAIPGLVLQ